MKCEKCGSDINQGENFCRNCGNPVGVAASPQIDPFNVGNAAPAPAAPSPVPETPAPVAAPNPVLQTEAGAVNNAPVAPVPGAPEANANAQAPVNQEVVKNTGITVDEELLDAYIGKNATEIKRGGFSWCTFLFSSVYLFYRKMWLYGVIVLLAPTIISLVFPLVGGLLSLVGIIVLATKIKGLYVKDAEAKIGQIISDNPGKSKEEIKTLCASKGGTTIVPVIIYVILILVIPIAFTAFMFPKLKEGILRGQLSGNGYDKLDHLVYKVPDNMIPSASNDDTYKSYSTSENAENYCHISVTSYYGATYENDPEVYLNKSVYTKGTDSKTTSSYETKDGTNWAQVLVETEYSNKYYYATSYKDRIYSIEYSETNEDDPCSEKYEELLSSLKFEE